MSSQGLGEEEARAAAQLLCWRGERQGGGGGAQGLSTGSEHSRGGTALLWGGVCTVTIG